MPTAKMTPVKFVREHLKTKLIEAGHTEATAEALVAAVSDKEIESRLPKEGVKVQGEGKWLEWLVANGPKIVEVVNTIFDLLALTGATAKDDE